MAKDIILFHDEKLHFKTEKAEDGSDKVIISGNAQPLNEDSRNGVRYRAASVKKAHKTLKNAAFLFNHDAAVSLGHVADVGLSDTHVTYSADIDPEEKDYIRKVERGDIAHVSVGCLVKNIEWNEDDQIFICDVQEYVELSAVTCPGFQNTSANKENAIYLANAIGNKEVEEKLKASAEKFEKKEDEEKYDDDEDEEEEKKSDDDEDEEEEKSDDDEKDDEDEDDDEKKDDEEALDGVETEDAEGEDPSEDSEESAKKSKTEGADEETSEGDETEEGTEEVEDEETLEEKVERMDVQHKEIFSKLETIENRMAALESKVDAEEEDVDPKKTEDAEADEDDPKDLEPSKDEKFTNAHADKQALAKDKKNIEAKDKVLGKEGKKEEVNLEKTRLANKPY